MKTVRETDDQLILANTPWLLAICLAMFILVFTGAGLALLEDDLSQGLMTIMISLLGGGLFLVLFVRRTQLILDKPTGRITLRRRGFIGYSETHYALGDLSKAVIESSRSRKHANHTRRVALTFNDGPDTGTHPVTITYVNGKGPGRAADTINAWLSRARKATSPEIS